jgi:hypothetical protein
LLLRTLLIRISWIQAVFEANSSLEVGVIALVQSATIVQNHVDPAKSEPGGCRLGASRGVRFVKRFYGADQRHCYFATLDEHPPPYPHLVA